MSGIVVVELPKKNKIPQLSKKRVFYYLTNTIHIKIVDSFENDEITVGLFVDFSLTFQKPSTA